MSPSDVFRRGRPVKYPWDLWVNGQQHVARKGLDFSVTVESFCSILYGRATSESTESTTVKVRTKIEGDSVYFQFYEMEESKP